MRSDEGPTLLDLTFEELEERLGGLPRFRARQIWQGVYRDLAASYEGITTLPAELRDRLSVDLPFAVLEPIDESIGKDGLVRKDLHRLTDGEQIEAVLMLYAERSTACVSSQVGCALGCPFCATGQSGFVRNLSPGEIVAQVLHAARRLRDDSRRLSHVVYMGMGEPLLNYDAVIRSIRILNDSTGFGLGARSFTVSTAGIPPGIDRLADEGLQVNLAVSLHAAEDRLRDRLVPVNRRHPIAQLLNAVRRYIDRTHRRVTFEIALMHNVNDGETHAAAAGRLLHGLLCHVNLIPYNETPSGVTRRSTAERIEAFAARLAEGGIPVTIRKRMGTDIEAGCGQLRARKRSAGASEEERRAGTTP